MPRTVKVAAIGDANSPATWSGTPYHLLQAARMAGLADEGLDLSTDGLQWKLRRAAWNALQVGARWDRYGGYQYSVDFLEALWAPVRGVVRGGAVIQCFQLLPPSIVADASIEKWIYVDMTLPQLFGHYDLARTVGRRIRAEALAREREGYAAAAGVICHSHWMARSVVDECGVPASKVHVVVPGANIDLDAYEAWSKATESKMKPTPPGRSLRLLFIGKDWRRKGLDRLLRAYAAARSRGASLSLRVVGCDRARLPAELGGVPDVEWIGFVDKRQHTSSFLDLIADCDLGCHLSRAEAGGIAQREFHAAGLAILGTDVGGAREHRFEAASVNLSVDAADEEIADKLSELAADRTTVIQMKQRAWKMRRLAMWPASVSELRGIIRGPASPT